MSRETVGHLQSAYCEGQSKAVTNAHHNCFRELQYDLAKHASKDGQVPLEGEQTLKTMWKGRELDELCTMEHLDETIHGIEAATNGWTVKQVNFIMGTRLIEVSSCDKSMQELGVSKDIADRLRSRHMRKLLEEHEYVLQSWGGTVCLLITMNNRNSIRSPGVYIDYTRVYGLCMCVYIYIKHGRRWWCKIF